MSTPQSSVAQMVNRMLQQSYSRIERGTFTPSEELEAIQRQLSVAQQLEDLILQGHSYALLGMCQWYTGQLESAIEHFHTAEQHYRKAQSYANLISTLAYCGEVYRMMGDTQSAFDILKECDFILNHQNVSNYDGAISLMYATRGWASLDAQNYKAAARDFDMVFKVHEHQSQDHTFAATRAWRGIAEVYLYQKQWVAAQSISRLAFEAAQRSQNPIQRYAAHMLRGRLAWYHPAQKQEAPTYFEAAEKILQEIQVPALQVLLRLQEARHFIRLADIEQAQQFLSQAEAALNGHASEHPDIVKIWEALVKQITPKEETQEDEAP